MGSPDSAGGHRRPRVLISAYACDPEQGSEPAVGWHWAQEAAVAFDVHVITRSNNRQSIERYIPPGGAPTPTFHYLDLPRPLQRWKKKTGTQGLVAYYYLWQLAAARLARRLDRELSFDLLHHVTFANDWLPSGLALLRGRKFIWGPVGGSTHRAPAEVERSWTRRERRYEKTRRWVQQGLIRFDPILRRTARSAITTLPYTSEAAEARHLGENVRVVTHIGTSPRPPARPPDGSGPLVLVTGGRLVHWKGHDLVIRAVARVLEKRADSIRVIVTGKGPTRGRLEDLARRLHVSRSVSFVGHLPNAAQVERLIAGADLFALPTWRDGPPVAVLEAMSVGTPPLCLDLGATGELVPDGAGLKIDPFPTESVVDRIAEALDWSLDHRTDLARMGEAARLYALEHHGWDVIGGQIIEIYQETLERSG